MWKNTKHHNTEDGTRLMRVVHSLLLSVWSDAGNMVRLVTINRSDSIGERHFPATASSTQHQRTLYCRLRVIATRAYHVHRIAGE